MRWPFEALFETRGLQLPTGFATVRDLLGPGPTAAGLAVTEETVEGLPTVFACVRVIASAVAQLPLKLFRVGPDGRKTEAADHPLYEVLHDLANPEMTAYGLRALLTAQLLLWGNAYAQIDRDARGQVTALWPLPPWGMRVRRDDRRRLHFAYYASHQDAQPTREWTYDPARPPLLRLQINTLNGITGRSVVTVLREALGRTAAMQRFGSTSSRTARRSAAC